jgi:hypothetical protein
MPLIREARQQGTSDGQSALVTHSGWPWPSQNACVEHSVPAPAPGLA